MIAFITLLWNRRRFLLASTLTGLVISVTYAYIAPTQYQSTVSLMPPDPSVFSSGDLPDMAAGMGTPKGQYTSALASGFLGESTIGDLFLGILQSRTVQDAIINRFDLRRVYHTRRYDDARRVLTRNTDAKEEAKSKIISITVTDRDPKRAQAIANAYVDELDDLVSHVTTSGAHRERVFLEGRLSSLKVELDSASLALGQFSSRSGTLDVENQGKAILDATAKVQGELIAARSDLSGLESIYAADNERVRAAQARVAELDRELRKMGGIGQTPASAESLTNQVYPSLRELPIMGSEYLDLSRKVRTLEGVYELLTREYELAKVEEAREIPSVKVLDAANLPERRSFPRRKIIVVVGVFIFFVCSALWVWLQAAWKGMNSSDPRKILLCDMAGSLGSVFSRKRNASQKV